MTNGLTIGQLVKGKGSAPMLIIDFRIIDGEDYAQVKAWNPTVKKPMPGEFALPVEILRAV